MYDDICVFTKVFILLHSISDSSAALLSLTFTEYHSQSHILNYIKGIQNEVNEGILGYQRVSRRRQNR